VFGADGRYRPLPASASLLAFARLDRRGMPRLITVVARAEAPIEGSEIDVELALPSGEWRHVLLDDEPPAQGSLDVGASLGRFPAVVLVT
jgi:maltooligosyltrehalose synthase